MDQQTLGVGLIHRVAPANADDHRLLSQRSERGVEAESRACSR
jgi:hypothetical protein